jgi:hypothetical protein
MMKLTIRQNPSGGTWGWSLSDRGQNLASGGRAFKTKAQAWAGAKKVLNVKKLDVEYRTNADREAEAAALET